MDSMFNSDDYGANNNNLHNFKTTFNHKTVEIALKKPKKSLCCIVCV